MRDRSVSSTAAVWAIASVFSSAVVAVALLGHRGAAGQLVSVRFGYTFALLLFVVPLMVHGWIAVRFDGSVAAIWGRPFRVTIASTFVIGLALDVVFGGYFLRFPSDVGVCGLKLPGYRPGVGWSAYIPVEEFAFYILGMMWIVSNYAVFDRYVFAGAPRARRPFSTLLSFSMPWTLVVVLLGAISWSVRSLRIDSSGAIAGYATFILFTTGIPPIVLWRRVSSSLNQPALAVTFALLTLLSIVWEPTLGLPLGWWGYNEQHMCGLTIAAWGGMPVEAVLFWWASVLTGVLLFQTAQLTVADHG